MKFSEKQVKDIVALKESLIEQINRHQESIEMLEKNIVLLDSSLIDSSFTKASQLERKNQNPEIKVKQKPIQFQLKEEMMEK